MEHNKKIEYTYKTYLKYSNDIFIYNNNKNNILLEGTKAINVYKKRIFLSIINYISIFQFYV